MDILLEIKQFENFLISKKYSESTQRTYSNLLYHYFLKYEQVTKDNVENYLLFIKNNNLSYSTMNQLLNAIKQYQEFKKITVEIFKRPIRPKLNIKYYDMDIINLVLKHCKNSREKFLILLIYTTGLRIHQIANLKLKDIKFIKSSEQIKGNKKLYIEIEQKIYFPEILKKTFLNYLDDFYLSEYIFEKYNSKTKKYNKLSKRRLISIINEIETRIRKKEKHLPNDFEINQRTLRNSCAKHLMDKNPFESVQYIMGYKNARTLDKFITPKKIIESELITDFDLLKV